MSLIPRLLAGKDQLSRPEKDAILADVLAGVAVPRRAVWRRGLALAMAGVAAVAIAVIAVRSGRDRDRGGATDELAARGGSAASAAFALSCPAAPAGLCRSGDTLAFDLGDSAGYARFAAFARGDDGTVIWYFPEEPEGRSLDLHSRLSDGVLDRGVSLTGAHRSGHYQVYGVFSAEPLSRAEIKQRFRDGASDLGPGTAVIAQALVIR